MGLLKYTTTIPVPKTTSAIFELLRAQDADAIMLTYNEHREPNGISFTLRTAQGGLSFKMSVDTDRVKQLLIAQYRQRKVPVAAVREGQPQRVAWRIVLDWLEVQVALIQIGLVTLEQVMLPYAVAQDGRTVFDVVQDRGGVQKMLGGGQA